MKYRGPYRKIGFIYDTKIEKTIYYFILNNFICLMWKKRRST